MKQYFLIAFILGVCTVGYSQKYASEKSFVSFYSHALIEDITAQNTKSNAIFNSETGDIAFSIPMKEFKFAKSLSRKHIQSQRSRERSKGSRRMPPEHNR